MTRLSATPRDWQTPPVDAIELSLPDLAATEHLAARVAALARPGDAILLAGPLGVGKTAFARAFLRAATGDRRLEVPAGSAEIDFGDILRSDFRGLRDDRDLDQGGLRHVARAMASGAAAHT